MTVIIPFNKVLKEKREQLGISWDRAAAMLCLSEMEYYDLEAHEDEWRNIIPALVIRFAVSIFEIDWRNSYSWPEGGAVEPAMPLHEFWRSTRQTRGRSREEFADRVGYAAAFTEVIEGDQDGLALSPLSVTIDLAQAFDIKVISLVECVLRPHVVYARIAAARRGE